MGRFKSNDTLDIMCSRFEELGDSCIFSWTSEMLSFLLLTEPGNKDACTLVPERPEDTTAFPPGPPVTFPTTGSDARRRKAALGEEAGEGVAGASTTTEKRCSASPKAARERCGRWRARTACCLAAATERMALRTEPSSEAPG
jgi:hypothetical protein